MGFVFSFTPISPIYNYWGKLANIIWAGGRDEKRGQKQKKTDM
jgi:hypothetical protein